MPLRVPVVVVLLLAAAIAAAAGPLPPLPPAIASKVPQLDCEAVTARDIAQVLSGVPAPRVIALHGSVPIVTMEPFADFLEAMGYPAAQLVNPVDGARTRSSYIDSRRLAGHVAWHYEQEGLMPVLIGHSQGGMVVIKMLHDLAGTRSAEPIPVWNPHDGEASARTAIVDPWTGATREVRDLRIGYAAVLATGSLPRLLLGQWGILPLLRDVPDSAIEFTGFAIPWDPIAGTGPRPSPYHATGTARVRNVILPASYSHIELPRAAHLARQPEVRAWIEAYRPASGSGTSMESPTGAELSGSANASDHVIQTADISNLVHAADIWYSLKRQWCEGAKRMVALRPGAPQK